MQCEQRNVHDIGMQAMHRESIQHLNISHTVNLGAILLEVLNQRIVLDNVTTIECGQI